MVIQWNMSIKVARISVMIAEKQYVNSVPSMMEKEDYTASLALKTEHMRRTGKHTRKIIRRTSEQECLMEGYNVG